MCFGHRGHCFFKLLNLERQRIFMIRTLLLTLILMSPSLMVMAREAVVVGVTDGRTLELENQETVQLSGLAAPVTSEDRDMDRKAVVFLQNQFMLRPEVRLLPETTPSDGNEMAMVQAYSLLCKGACSIERVQGYEYKQFDDGVYIDLNNTLISSRLGRPEYAPAVEADPPKK